MSSTAPTGFLKVVIEGLKKVRDVKQDGWNAAIDDISGLYRLSLTLPEDEPVWDGLWQKIEDYGFAVPRILVHGGIEYRKHLPAYTVREYNEVLVVADDQASSPTTIRISETLISHTNTHQVPPLEFKIENLSASRCEVRDNHGFCVSFERTIRMPDDNKPHHLPESLGQYELFNVDAYSKRLPDNVKEAGGVFFPMWQREAMWLNFQQGSHKYAVRVFVGHVNAITGLELQKETDLKSEQNSQDYIVIPGQQWLDGICVAPGIVRQFVAMPLGSGYTVEGQKTSEEKHGGLQLEVTPELVSGKRFWSNAKKHHIAFLGPYKYASRFLEELSTPSELGCKIGDILRSYSTEAEHRLLRIHDLVASGLQGPIKSGVTQNIDSLKVATITFRASGGIFAPLLERSSRGTKEHAFRGIVMGVPPENPCQNSAPVGKITPAGFNPPHHEPEPLFDSAIYVAKNKVGNENMCNEDLTAFSGGIEVVAQSVKSADEIDTIELLHTVEKCVKSANVEDKTDSSKLLGVIAKSVKPAGEEDTTSLVDLSEFETKNIKTMGLAAGGKLIQDIYKDPYPATTWNHAAARILHVHMLDPESCEQVTHIVPRPPPMDVKEYVKSGGKFYVVEEKIDERLDGGDFDNVKSVSQMDKQVGITKEPEFDPTKPKMCTTCEIRLCDCIVRPCTHQFCNVCIKGLEQGDSTDSDPQRVGRWKCPTCNTPVSHVAGFSAPMNLPGEEPLPRTKVPVHVLKIQDGRARFSSTQTSRV